MLAREHRLRGAAAFRRIYREGRSWAHPAAVLYTFPQPAPAKQFAVVTSRKLGGAVRRNRIRRRLMAACRQLEAQVRPGLHAVIIARAPAATLPPIQLRAALAELLGRAGALALASDDSRSLAAYEWPAQGGRRPAPAATPAVEGG
jgi:ribonuclease P protein component